MASDNILLNDNHLYSLIHFREEVINALADSGYHVCLSAPSKNKHPKFDYIDQSVEIEPMPLNRTSLSISNIISYTSDLCKLISRKRPLVVFNYTILPILCGGLAAKIRGVPSVAFFAGLNSNITGLLNKKSLKARMTKHILSRILSFNRTVVFLNEEDRKNLVEAGMVRHDQALLLNGGEGVDLTKYQPASHSAYASTGRFKMVMIARVLKTKGYDEFVYCARKCKEEGLPIDFYLAGGADETHPAGIPKEQINRHRDEGLFEYNGHLLNLQEFMDDTDCVILPSYYNEGMNRSLMEALSMGIPIITTQNRGCRELVLEGKTGYTIPIKDGNALYNAVLKFIHQSDEDRAKMRKESRKYAEERFDVKDVVNKYLHIIQSI